MLSSRPGFGQCGDTKDAGRMLCSASRPAVCHPSCSFLLRLCWAFAALVLSELDWAVFPQCHTPEIQKVLPVFHSMPEMFFFLLPQRSQALSDCTSPTSYQSPAGHLTTFRREDQQKTKDPPSRGARAQNCLGPVQPAFPHTHGNFLGSLWANPLPLNPIHQPGQR